MRDVLIVYLATGLVRSVFRTRYLRSLMEQPAGGMPRLVAVYLLCALFWLPMDALYWLHAKLHQGQGDGGGSRAP